MPAKRWAFEVDVNVRFETDIDLEISNVTRLVENGIKKTLSAFNPKVNKMEVQKNVSG